MKNYKRHKTIVVLAVKTKHKALYYFFMSLKLINLMLFFIPFASFMVKNIFPQKTQISEPEDQRTSLIPSSNHWAYTLIPSTFSFPSAAALKEASLRLFVITEKPVAASFQISATSNSL